MTEIPIQTLLPSSGAVPLNAYDPQSRAGYTAWDLDDEARFSIVVPNDYHIGSDFYLRLHESSNASSASHRWQVTTLLLRPGIHNTDELTKVETHIQEFESSSRADRLTLRTFAVTGSGAAGCVSDAPIQATDILAITMKRIAASTNEDPNPIRLFDVSLETATSETALSQCAGRVGTIVDSVRDLFNEATGGFLSDDLILRSINRCQQELAQENYWRREAWVRAASGVSEVELLSALPDYQDIHQAHFSGCDHPMAALPGFREYQELKTGALAPGVPEYYLIQNNKMYVWPPPQSDLSSGYRIYHSYMPEELTCSSVNPNPSIPRAHDMIFVYFTLKQAFLRDRHAPGADVKFQEYLRLYEMEKQRLLGEGDPPLLALRSYR
jgi:hypothetical protein